MATVQKIKGGMAFRPALALLIFTGTCLAAPFSATWQQYQPVNFNLTNQKEKAVAISLYQGHQFMADGQTITGQSLVYHMKPVSVKALTNTWGDASVLATFRPVRSGYITGTVSFEQVIKVERGVRSPGVLDDCFPFPSNKASGWAEALAEGDGVVFEGRAQARQAWLVSGGSPRVAEAAAAVVLWVRRSIRPSGISGDATQVFTTREGDRPSRLRLAAAMIRSLGIPCRFGKGEAVDGDLVSGGAVPTRMAGGRGDLTWLEVLSRADSGATHVTPFLLEGPLFWVPPSVLRNRCSSRLGDLTQKEEGLLERYCQNTEIKGELPLGLLDHAPATTGETVPTLVARLGAEGVLPPSVPAGSSLWFDRDMNLPVAETLHLGLAGEPRWSVTFDMPARPLGAVEVYLRRLDAQGAVVRLLLKNPSTGKILSKIEVPTWALGDGALWKWAPFPLGKETIPPGSVRAELELSVAAMVDVGAQWSEEDPGARGSKVDGQGQLMEKLAGRLLLRLAAPGPVKK